MLLTRSKHFAPASDSNSVWIPKWNRTAVSFSDERPFL